MNKALAKAIREILRICNDGSTKIPSIKFALAQGHSSQFISGTMNATEHSAKMSEGIKMMDHASVGKIDSPVKMSQVLEQDGIYFTESSGKVYINGLLYNAD
jgi:hypothetical protein